MTPEQLKKIAEAAKKGKAKGFMAELQVWITSPGGIITVLLFIGAIAYVHHKTSK